MWKNVYQFRHALVRRGFKLLGEGLYSEVYAKPGSRFVIKVARRFDGWPQWIDWAARNGHLGGKAPLVTSLKVITPIDGEVFYVAVMERLEKTFGEVRLARGTKNAKWRGIVRGYDKHSKEWSAVFGAFSKHYGNKGFIDLHDGNWMIRADGSVVATDPVADSCGSSEGVERLKSSAVNWHRPPAALWMHAQH